MSWIWLNLKMSISIFGIRTQIHPTFADSLQKCMCPSSDCINSSYDVQCGIDIPILCHYHACGITTINCTARPQMWVLFC